MGDSLDLILIVCFVIGRREGSQPRRRLDGWTWCGHLWVIAGFSLWFVVEHGWMLDVGRSLLLGLMPLVCQDGTWLCDGLSCESSALG